ncbi:MAG: hypothetical protein PHP03_03575 [Candidatus Pacebacteria bacterium]|nr:hypothetical protein [Candidatus Paceibacterota bacterium]
MLYLYRVPVTALVVLPCIGKEGLGMVSPDNVLVPGISKRSAVLNFYKIHKLSVKERPKIGMTGMMWIDRKRKVKRVCSDPLLIKTGKGSFICGDCTGKCPAVGNGILESHGGCPMVDTIESERS